MEELLRIFGVLALVGANAFFVVGEYAVVTARRSAVQARTGRSPASARAALRLMDDPVKVISTVQVGITAIGILTGAVGEPLVAALLPDAIPSGVSFVVAFAVVTYLSVVLGELVPKAITLDRADAVAVWVARPVEALSVVLRPVVWVLQGSAQLLLRPLGIREVIAGDGIRSPQELRELVDEAEGEGVIPTAQETLIHNVIDFAERRAGDVMTPAPDVVALRAEEDAAAALARIAEEPYSRYPVTGPTGGDVVGVVLLRDLGALAAGDSGTVADALRDVHVVPRSKPLGALLRELRQRRGHLAVVGDEFGRMLGVVTLEDVLEELVGQIEDETDRPADRLEPGPDGAVAVPGELLVEDLAGALGVPLRHERASTVGGMAFDALGRRPEPGEEVTVDGVLLRVDAVEGARATRLTARVVTPEVAG